ncbi:MAG: apolipoprotein N-acyltransferase [Candidatus Omnitrophota bacterium]
MNQKNKQMKVWVKIAFSVLSGILCFFAFPPFGWSFLGWIGFVPLLLVIHSSRSIKEAFGYSYFAGLVFFAGLLYWLVNVTVPGMIILLLALSFFYGLFGAVGWYIIKCSMDLLLLPFVWVILEYLRGIIFTGFPWGGLGYSQYKDINIIQIADFTGSYGVSFLLMVFNTAVFAFLSRSKRKKAYMITALFFLIMTSVYGVYRLDNYCAWGNPKLSVIQGNIPQEYKWDQSSADDIMDIYTSLTREAADKEPDMIIWPETSYPYLVENTDQPAQEISLLSAETGVPILAGVVRRQNKDYYNSAILFDKQGNVAGTYDKNHLVPFGEYIPFGWVMSFLRNYIDKPIGNLKKGNEYTLFALSSLKTASKGELRTRKTSFYKFGVLICFEDIFPYIARRFVKQGAGFLVNITNDAWFGKTAAAEQHLQASVFRAIENRVPVIRAANTGISCFIDFTGKVISKLDVQGNDIFVRGTDTVEFQLFRGRSFYTLYGDIFVLFCFVMALLIFLMEQFILKKEK